jgi:F-type H+-transporting ATPase subunit delta
MIELATQARPYAVAAYKRAKETGKTSAWSDSLSFLTLVFQDERILRAAKNPKADKQKFTQALLDLCQAHLDADTKNFVRLLIDNRRLELISNISALFESYRAEEEGYIAVDVISAFELEKNERNKIEAALRVTLGKEPRLNVSVDESLIGGVLIRAGDRVIDASVRGQIQRLAQRLYN